MTTRKQSVWSSAELHRHLDEGSRFSILDVRNRDEFDAWKIEGKQPIHNLSWAHKSDALIWKRYGHVTGVPAKLARRPF